MLLAALQTPDKEAKWDMEKSHANQRWITPAPPTLDPLFLRHFGELVLGYIDSYDNEQTHF